MKFEFVLNGLVVMISACHLTSRGRPGFDSWVCYISVTTSTLTISQPVGEKSSISFWVFALWHFPQLMYVWSKGTRRVRQQSWQRYRMAWESPIETLAWGIDRVASVKGYRKSAPCCRLPQTGRLFTCSLQKLCFKEVKYEYIAVHSRILYLES